MAVAQAVPGTAAVEILITTQLFQRARRDPLRGPRNEGCHDSVRRPHSYRAHPHALPCFQSRDSRKRIVAPDGGSALAPVTSRADAR
jgi:hypothetical protein